MTTCVADVNFLPSSAYTFCPFSDPELNVQNPDMTHPVYSTEDGIYKPGCGIMVSGHSRTWIASLCTA